MAKYFLIIYLLITNTVKSNEIDVESFENRSDTLYSIIATLKLKNDSFNFQYNQSIYNGVVTSFKNDSTQIVSLKTYNKTSLIDSIIIYSDGNCKVSEFYYYDSNGVIISMFKIVKFFNQKTYINSNILYEIYEFYNNWEGSNNYLFKEDNQFLTLFETNTFANYQKNHFFEIDSIWEKSSENSMLELSNVNFTNIDYKNDTIIKVNYMINSFNEYDTLQNDTYIYKKNYLIKYKKRRFFYGIEENLTKIKKNIYRVDINVNTLEEVSKNSFFTKILSNTPLNFSYICYKKREKHIFSKYSLKFQ